MKQSKEDLLKIADEILLKRRYAMVATRGRWWTIHIRALQCMKNDGFSKFYFVTRRDSLKVKEMKRHKRGTIYFYDKDNYSSIMLIGTYKIDYNPNYGLSDIYKIAEHDLFDNVGIIFHAKTMYLYSNYKTTKFKINKKKE